MEIKSQINTFTTGMDLDTALSSVPNTSYRYAQNIRVVTDNDGTTAILNESDTIRRYLVSSNWQLDGIVLGVVTSKAYNYEDRYTNVAYVLLQKIIDNETYNTILEVSNFDRQDLTTQTVCSGYWNISGDVQMVFNYETKDICKLYITDGNNSLKVINIKDGYNRELTADDIDIHSNCVLTPPTLLSVVSGSLPVGQVQYCYQLFSKNGGQSNLSPVSVKIPTIENESQSNQVNGYANEQDLISNVGVELSISIYNASDLYNGIRIYRIEYKTSTDAPLIYLINETQLVLENGATTITFTDSGISPISQQTVEEFNDSVFYDFVTQTICKKDNRLFAANIKETQWDAEYDARAYRCNKQGLVKLESATSSDYLSLSLSEIISGSYIVPETHDCINPLNNYPLYPTAGSDGDYSYYQYYGSYYYGGAGPNVSYKFIQMIMPESESTTVLDSDTMTYRMKYDISASAGTYNTIYGFDSEGVSYEFDLGRNGIVNYSNAEIVSRFQTYQRDEVYRFGLVMYNSKNQPSPVHWIADVRFPAADCKLNPGQSNLSFAPYAYNINRNTTNAESLTTTTANELSSRALGILFKVNNLPEDVKAVEIVRCRRTQADRTVVTQGALGKLMLWDNYEGDVTNSNELRPYIIPGFARKHNVATVGMDGDGDDEFPTLLTYTPSNNANDVFEFISADQDFNKDTEIVRPGDYIVPLYVASSVIQDTSNKEYNSTFTLLGNGGIQFQAEERRGEYSYNQNYTGTILDVGDNIAITDGFEPWCYVAQHEARSAWVIPCAEFKYFKFYDKSNAKASGYSTQLIRDRKLIDNVKIATNIPNTEVVTNIADINNKYIDQISNYTYQNISIGGWYNHSFSNTDDIVRYGIHGVTLLLQSSDMWGTDVSSRYCGIYDQLPSLRTQMSDDNVYGVQSILICNIKRNIQSQYGGNSYFSRSNSVYNIPCGYKLASDNDQITCFSGDTYLGILDHTYTGLVYPNDADSNPLRSNTAFIQTLFPLESSVNVYARHDQHFLQNTTAGGNQQGGYGNTYYMTEVGVNRFGSQSEPMYTYNSAYSNTDGARNLVQKGVYDEDSSEWTNRIVVSEVKTNGEVTDSWMTFRFADYLDVDNQYGKITNLINFQDRLYFFQDEALGVAQVNERSLITDNNASQLVLGTGTVLGRYDYIVQKYGDSKIRDKSIVTSSSTMYWFDYDKNILCAYNNSIIELSKIKKVQSFINNTPKQNKTDVISLYDNKYNEVWFSINGSSLVFNEQGDFFSSFYTHAPNFVLSFSDYTATIKGSSVYYIHDVYNLQNEDVEDKTCKLTIVVNDNYVQTKVYDNVFFDAEFDELNQIKEIQFTTKTQYTDPIDYQVIDNREDTYRFFIPREHLDDAATQQTESMSYAARMRGKYLICDYTFDCNDERQIEIPFIKTTYRDSLV